MQSDSLESRIIELENQLVFQQETIDSLNDMVTKQWAMLERQQKLIKQMDDQIYALESQAGHATATECPPHY